MIGGVDRKRGRPKKKRRKRTEQRREGERIMFELEI